MLQEEKETQNGHLTEKKTLQAAFKEVCVFLKRLMNPLDSHLLCLRLAAQSLHPAQRWTEKMCWFMFTTVRSFRSICSKRKHSNSAHYMVSV